MKMCAESKDTDKFKLVAPQPESTQKLPTRDDLSSLADYRKHYPVFCFKHLDEADKEFHLKKVPNTKEFCRLLCKLKMYSHLTWAEIEKNEKYHAHDLNWANIAKNRFPDGCGDFPPYQFAVSDQFRVIGYHDRDRFYVVWLDPFHKMMDMS